ncbi:MAG: metal-dependent transcriptional regulator [Desulfobulbaceae bacterium]|jgi:DtxR family Mn-dependent transcriptional regulator|nr:metal-dependent transcriptional regulator [Desulfobulbaceae bacterium]
MKENIGLSESLEDYLEVILKLEQAQKVARAKDIAEKMNVQRGSVTGALKNLKEKKLINYEPYSFITLTPKGKKLAREITRRHAVLKDFLFNVLQIDTETAEATACRMEHAIDKKTLERLVCFIDYVHKFPKAGEDWIKSFIKYCKSVEQDLEKCD